MVVNISAYIVLKFEILHKNYQKGEKCVYIKQFLCICEKISYDNTKKIYKFWGNE